MASVASEFHQHAHFSVRSFGGTHDQLNGNVWKLRLEPANFGNRWVGHFANPKEQFKLRVVLLGLGDKGRISIGVEAAERLEHRDWRCTARADGCVASELPTELQEAGKKGQQLITGGWKK